jgi:serine/threonine protein kinase
MMSPAQWQEVKRIVDEALELDGREREFFLSGELEGKPDLRAEVESLLEATDRAGPFLAAPVRLDGLDEADADPLIGTRLGPYLVERLIGQGGMGAVYRAVRHDGEFRMSAAIKVVKRGMDTDGIVRRFRVERQILARLSHPYIAHLLDGGVTPDSRPYFVMEFVEGRRLDETTPELTLDQRLELFLRICQAIEHAHRNLIIHGDIKATNILVTTDGKPKLLDFGIARLVETDPDRTRTEEGAPVAFTPEYSSPEQIRGTILTTASDVYSLGILLCEVLAGRRPFTFELLTPDHVLRVITTREPKLPSVLAGDRRLKGDLDNIVRKAIQPDPASRYPSVEQFADDIRNYRNGRPVSAQPATFWYRASKFARRNRIAVAASAAVVLALAIGLAVATWQAAVARIERQSAERRFDLVRELAREFIFTIDAEIAPLRDSTPARNKIVTLATQYLDRLSGEAEGNAALQREVAEAYLKLGDLQGRPASTNVGNTQGALESYSKALAISEKLYAANPRDTALAKNLSMASIAYSAALKVVGNYKAALALDKNALDLCVQLAEQEPSEDNQRLVAEAYTILGGSYALVGDLNQVLDTRVKGYKVWRQLVVANSQKPENSRGLSLASRRLGGILLETGDRPNALAHYREALAIEKQLLQAAPNDVENKVMVAIAHQALGNALTESGDHAAAAPELRLAIGIYEALVDADPRETRRRALLATAQFTLGVALTRSGEPRRALSHLQESAKLREMLSLESPLNAGARGQVGESYSGIADAWAALGQREQALNWYRRARDILDSLQNSGRANFAIRKIRTRNAEALARLEQRNPIPRSPGRPPAPPSPAALRRPPG